VHFARREEFLGYSATAMRGLIIDYVPTGSGFSFGEIAALRGMTDRTIRRQSRSARLLLHRTLQTL
jgi:hypothetical protein